MIGTTTYASQTGHELQLMCLEENLMGSATVAEELGNLSDQQMPEKMQELKKFIHLEAKTKALVNQLQMIEIQQKQREAGKIILNQSLNSCELYRQMIYRDITYGTFFSLCLKTNQDGKYGEFERQKYYWLHEWDSWQQEVHKTRGVCDWIISPAIYDISATKREFKKITHIYSFWADFDAGAVGHKKSTLFKDTGDCRYQVLQNLQALELIPTLWFFSGYGFHAYWCVTENLIRKLNQDQIENMNEALYQAGLGSSGEHYNEIKTATTLVRSPFPGTNLKIVNSPVATKLEQLHGLYDLADIINKILPVMQIRQIAPKQIFITGQGAKLIQPSLSPIIIHRIGDIDKVLADKEFMDWLSDSTKLNYYKNTQYQFDSTSAKEAWIIFYLWLCGLDTEQILDFFQQYADEEYHLLRTRKKKSAQIELIEYNVRKKCERAEQGQCSAKIKKEHIMEVNWDVN